MPLSDSSMRNLKPAGQSRKVADSKGLHVLVTASGSRLWRWSYRFGGKQKTLALGAYPAVSLAEARRRCEEARVKLATGHDPALPLPSSNVTFKAVAEEWLISRNNIWKPAHKQRITSRLWSDVFPDLGERPIEDLTAPEILVTLRKIENRGAVETAKRMHQTIGQIMRYGVATGRAPRDPSSDLKGALKPSPRVRHMAALREKDLPDFFVKLDAYDGALPIKLAIELIVHTFVRTNELRSARWSEIDGRTWRIPAERMKMGREHLVPLTDHTHKLFERLREISSSSTKGDGLICPMSENTMLYAIYRMGFHSRATIHGFRSTASTILNESGLWSADAIERQLAHVPENTIRATYNAAQYLNERKRMMEWYSARLLTLADGSVTA